MRELGGCPTRIAIIIYSAIGLAVLLFLWSEPSSLTIIETFNTTRTSLKSSPPLSLTSSPDKYLNSPPLDLEASSAAHGWVFKAGPATLRSWDASEDIPRREAWDQFLEKRAAGDIPLTKAYNSVPPHGPDPWGCRLYFNHAYKIMFVRTAKTGSTTIVESIFPPCNVSPDVPHCMQRVADTSMEAADVIDIWRKYTVFTFTRNVWSRGISQYQYLVHFVRDTPQCRHITWDEYCTDPLSVGEICRKNAECCTKKWTHQDWHMRQQTSCFLTEMEEWAVDFIGRVEHFDDDLVQLFEKINEKKLLTMPDLKHTPAPPANFNPLDCIESDPEMSESDREIEEDYEMELITSSSKISGGDGVGISGGMSGRKSHLRRQLFGAFDTIDGNQLPDTTYCDKRQFYTGKHAACFDAMTSFFDKDVKLLHANLTTR